MNANQFVAISLCMAATAVTADEFDLSWHSIDGGGVMRSTGGDFELSGTIGQSDSGSSAGGEFQLNGGFWFELAPTDCNSDGVVNLGDHDSFVGCLAGPGSGLLTGCECFDTDRSGAVDLRDFAVSQRVYSGY